MYTSSRKAAMELGANTNLQLLISLLSPWQWFCSTRTLSNSLEVVLTAAALYHWPWGLPGTILLDSSAMQSPDSSVSSVFQSNSDILRHV